MALPALEQRMDVVQALMLTLSRLVDAQAPLLTADGVSLKTGDAAQRYGNTSRDGEAAVSAHGISPTNLAHMCAPHNYRQFSTMVCQAVHGHAHSAHVC